MLQMNAQSEKQPSQIFDTLRQALAAVGVGIIDGSLEAHDREILASLLSSLRAPIVVDVGAHNGGFASTVFEVCTNATVIAFEPNPSSFVVLNSIVPSGTNTLRCFNIAIGDREEDASLYFPVGREGSPLSSLYPQVIKDLHGLESSVESVSVRTLDVVIQELGIPVVHLLKMDMEGGELRALKGAKKLLHEGRIQAIHFEFNDMNIISRTFFKDFWDILHPQYKIYRISPSGPIHIAHYMPMFCELFAVQTILAVAV